jgi:hypothetical protein
MAFGPAIHALAVCSVPLRPDGSQAVVAQPHIFTNPAALAELKRITLDYDRATVIAVAKTEYIGKVRGTEGNRLDSWINQTLRDKDMALLSAEEKKAL